MLWEIFLWKYLMNKDRILKKNKTDDGRTWKFDDIEALQMVAKRVSRACENIKSRR